jgi:hypothetical protein
MWKISGKAVKVNINSFELNMNPNYMHCKIVFSPTLLCN